MRNIQLKYSLLFIFFLLFHATCLFSQNKDETLTYGEYLAKANQYKEEQNVNQALLFAEMAKLAAEKELVTNSAEYASTLHNVGNILYFAGRHRDAEELHLRALNIYKKKLGVNSLEYTKVLTSLAAVYAYLGETYKAELAYLETLENYKRIEGENTLNYAKNLHHLGSLNHDMGKYDEAESYYLKALNSFELSEEKDDVEYAITESALADLYLAMGNFSSAELFYFQAMDKLKRTVGENHSDYVFVLKGIGDLYTSTGRYVDAESFFKQALRIEENIFGKKNNDYASILNNLGNLYYYTKGPAVAEPLLAKAASIYKEVLGEDHINYAIALSGLGIVYQYMADFQRSESSFLQSLASYRKAVGEDHPGYASTLHYLGSLYRSIGEYDKAETSFLKSLDIYKKVLDQNSVEFSKILNGLALFYYNTCNYSKAEGLFKQVLVIVKNKLGEDHMDYSIVLGNLASLYRFTGRYLESESYYLETLKKQEILFEENDSRYAETINLFGLLYLDMKEYEKAENMILKAVSILRDSKEVMKYVTALNNLALLYSEMKRFEESEMYYIQAIDILKNICSENNPEYVSLIHDLGRFYDVQGRYAEAKPYYLKSFIIKRDNVLKNFSFLSESERVNYWLQEMNSFYFTYPTFSYKYYTQEPSISTLSYDNALLAKGLMLNASTHIQKTILQSEDSILISMWRELAELKKKISSLLQKPMEQQKEIPLLEEKANSLDKDITKKSQLYRNTKEVLTVSWKDVCESLQVGDAAIEFVNFNELDKDIYYALLLKKNSEYPQLIHLFESKQLDSLFIDTKSENDLYTPHRVSVRTKTKVADYAKRLYELVWEPIERELSGVQNVYYSPVGKLNQIAFAAIPLDETIVLMDKYNLYQLTSTREIISLNNQLKDIKEVAVFGGIRYDINESEAEEVLALAESKRSSLLTTRDIGYEKFNYLRGSVDEVQQITKILVTKEIKVKLHTDIYATEKAFKELDNQNYDVIHIATHGFFISEVDSLNPSLFVKDRFTGNSNPLLRSGLILAGANAALKKEEGSENREDGILTSQEISELNLSKTRMIVLSACETGLGDIAGNEGVLGLQRAFKLAGVKSIIMSLWKVPDKQTSELMQYFYMYWLTGIDRREAFKKAQSKVRQQYPEPKYWAGFVVVD